MASFRDHLTGYGFILRVARVHQLVEGQEAALTRYQPVVRVQGRVIDYDQVVVEAARYQDSPCQAVHVVQAVLVQNVAVDIVNVNFLCAETCGGRGLYARLAGGVQPVQNAAPCHAFTSLSSFQAMTS